MPYQIGLCRSKVINKYNNYLATIIDLKCNYFYFYIMRAYVKLNVRKL